MKIKTINKLKNGLYKITLYNETTQEEHAYKLTEDQLISLNLYSKKVVTEEELEALKDKERYSTFFTSALNYISYRMRSELEIEQYLKKKECSKVYQTEIINRLKLMGYIDDERYALEYVNYQVTMNLKGPMLLKRELRTKGIKAELIAKALSTYTEERQLESIKRLIKKSMKTTTNKPLRKLKEMVLKKLINKGYDYQLANTAMSTYTFDVVIDDDALIEKELYKLATKYTRKHEGYELEVKLTQALMRKGFDYETINHHVKQYMTSKGEEQW